MFRRFEARKICNFVWFSLVYMRLRMVGFALGKNRYDYVCTQLHVNKFPNLSWISKFRGC